MSIEGIGSFFDLEVIGALTRFFEKQGVSSNSAEIIIVVLSVTVIIFLSVLVNYIAKGLILSSIHKLIARSELKWDDALLNWNVFKKLAHLAPALVFYWLIPHALVDYPTLVAILVNVVIIYMIFIGIIVLDAGLNSLNEIYSHYPIAKDIPIKSFIQVLKIVIYFVAIILVIAIVAGKSPIYFLSGLGALTAVLLLIFKDAILGFVAGIQLASNKMVSVGDWVEMEKYDADGNVIDIALTTVKVQNWDNTVTTIPTYALISDSFKNWRHMSRSGGRRIKRAINIDLQSIKFCDQEMLKRFEKISFIADYLKSKQCEIDSYNVQNKIDYAALANGRRLTNIGTFRAYVIAYLKNHPMINHDLTLIVRQLEPSDHGLPLEIYAFCKDKVWENYEAIQADIFDHILAVIPEFDLRVYQSPSGADINQLVSAGSSLQV